MDITRIPLGKRHRGTVRKIPLSSYQDAQGNPLPYAAAHSPPGGVSIQGKRFAGGQFIPAEVMAKATTEEREAVESGEARSKPLPPEGGAKLKEPPKRRDYQAPDGTPLRFDDGMDQGMDYQAPDGSPLTRPTLSQPAILHILAAILASKANGDDDIVEGIQDWLADDPSGIEDAVHDMSGATPYARVIGLVRYFSGGGGWTAATSSRGNIKAVREGSKPLYGKAAERALAWQERELKGEPHPETAVAKSTRKKAEREPKREEARRRLEAALADPRSIREEDLPELAKHIDELTRDEARAKLRELGQRGGPLKRDIIDGIIRHVRGMSQHPPTQEPTHAPAATAEPETQPQTAIGDEPAGGESVPGATAGPGGPVADTTVRPASASPDTQQDAPGRSDAASPAHRVPADAAEINRRLDRYEKFFAAKGQHHVTGFLGKLREHINALGGDEALKALGEPRGQGDGAGTSEVQYWGVSPESENWQNMGDFMEAYLNRYGITPVLGWESDPTKPLISALGKPDQYVAGRDFKTEGMYFQDKLSEAKKLPGLESSEDLDKIVGKPVTHLTPDVAAKLDERYGTGGWVVKCYDDNAAAGYGIFFPQRAVAVSQDAKNTLWDAGENLAKYDFEQVRRPAYGNFGKAQAVLGSEMLPASEEHFHWDRPDEVMKPYGEKLLARAKEGGLYVPPEQLPEALRGQNMGGLEHDVYRDEKTGQFWKVTKGGHFGQNQDLPEYLARHAAANQIWPELGYEFHGLTNDADGRPKAIISMNEISGVQPSQDEVHAWFVNNGWEPEGDPATDDNGNNLGQWSWRDPGTGTVVSDANAGNFRRTGDKLLPVDVDIRPGPDTVKALPANEPSQVVGLRHGTSGHEFRFGSSRYQNTIHGDVRHWGDKAALAAPHENGAQLPAGTFMAQPAFPAVGISDAERAAGTTWHATNEGRVHLVTRPDGSVEVIPHATWLKGGKLPVVFENEHTRAMAAAAKAAIEKIPHEARKGQVYAPDVMRTANGFEVVELNAQGDHNGSGYLHDNHFTIDAYTAHLTGREPGHVQFIRKLLTRKEPKQKKPAQSLSDVQDSNGEPLGRRPDYQDAHGMPA